MSVVVTTGKPNLGSKTVATFATMSLVAGAAFAYALYRSVEFKSKPKPPCSGPTPEQKKKLAWKKKRLLPNNVIVPTIARLPQFSSASVIGQTIYVSGTLGTKPLSADNKTGGPAVLVDGGLRAETRQTMDNITTILRAVIDEYVADSRDASVGEEHDLPGLVLPENFNVWTTVGKVNITLRDSGPEAFAAMNEEYAKYFADSKHNPPARMTSTGVKLALNAAIEIEVTAQLPFHLAFGGAPKNKYGTGAAQRLAAWKNQLYT